MFEKMIWDLYLRMKQGLTQVTRTGYGSYGVYPYNSKAKPGEIDKNRAESDAEHTLGMAALVMLVAMYFPQLIHPSETALFMQVALLHEMGETVIGDIPDDGRRDEAKKTTKERQIVLQFVKNMPEPHGTNLIDAFIEFQDRTTRRGRLLYGLDKLEAVLQGLIYEKEGRGGDIRNKAAQLRLSEQNRESVRRASSTWSCLSDRDRENMERAHSTRLVDIWSVHFLELIQGMPEAPVLRRILKAAVLDVRGEWFDWAESLMQDEPAELDGSDELAQLDEPDGPSELTRFGEPDEPDSCLGWPGLD